VSLYQGESQPWTCKVSLRFKSKDGGSRDHYFTTTFDPGNVEDILIRAQLAILNPDSGINFLDIDITSFESPKTQAKFSEDTVVVEIVGETVDVTFIDLPGLFSATGDVRRNCVSLR